MKETMVKMDENTHSILKRWKEKLRQQGIKVPLGAAIREMEKHLKAEDVSFSRKDIKEINNALEKLKETLEKYNNPTFSDVVVKMDSMIKENGEKSFDYRK